MMGRLKKWSVRTKTFAVVILVFTSYLAIAGLLKNYFVAGVLFTALIAFLFLSFLDRLIFKPLNRLDRDMKNKVPNCFSNGGIDVNYDGDRLDALAKNINLALNRIDKDLWELDRLKNEKDIIRLAMDSVSDEIVIYDVGNTVRAANRPALERVGMPREKVEGKSIFEFDSLLSNELRTAADKHISHGKSWITESLIKGKNDSVYNFRITFTPLIGDTGNVLGTVFISEDIGEKKAYEDKIKHISNCDFLTDLANKAHFAENIKKRIRDIKHNEYIAVIFVDIDNFKYINNVYGPASGDELLRQAAGRLTQNFGELGCIARIEADEFALLIESLTDPNLVKIIARRVLKVFDVPFGIFNREFLIRVSLGSALFPDDASNHDLLVKCAKTAMYVAKTEKENFYQPYNSDLRALTLKNKEMADAVKAAIEKNEFELYFQPKILAGSNKIIGIEALSRWNTKEGMISPAQFILIADESGLIIPLSAWVLRAACLANKHLLDEGFEIAVSVNLTSNVIKHKDFFEMINSALDQSGIPAELLDIEIKEDVLAEDFESTRRIIVKLRKMGVSVSIDNFGRGSSSIDSLRKLPINRLKIDRVFIAELAENSTQANAVKAIISLANAFGFITTAECVENYYQMEILKRMGCREIQGSIIKSPVCFEELEVFVKNWSAGVDKSYES